DSDEVLRRISCRKLTCMRCYNAPPTTHTSTLSLHDALPISREADHDRLEHERAPGQRREAMRQRRRAEQRRRQEQQRRDRELVEDRKSTRLNSSHVKISYAVFCLKKKTAKT